MFIIPERRQRFRHVTLNTLVTLWLLMQTQGLSLSAPSDQIVLAVVHWFS